MRIKSNGFQNSRLFVNENDYPVALAVEYSNGKWGINDLDGNKIAGDRFDTPKAAMDWFVEVRK